MTDYNRQCHQKHEAYWQGSIKITWLWNCLKAWNWRIVKYCHNNFKIAFTLHLIEGLICILKHVSSSEIQLMWKFIWVIRHNEELYNGISWNVSETRIGNQKPLWNFILQNSRGKSLSALGGACLKTRERVRGFFQEAFQSNKYSKAFLLPWVKFLALTLNYSSSAAIILWKQ